MRTRAFTRRSVLRAAASLAFAALLPPTLLACAQPTAGAAQLPTVGPRPSATPLPAVNFPADEAPHRNLTEWWYYTGHLNGADSKGKQREYGFEFVVFQTLRGQVPAFYASHFAVTDITNSRFAYDQRSEFRPLALLPAPGSLAGFDLSVAEWRMRGVGGHDELTAAMPDKTIQLQLVDQLPRPVLHDSSGLISYGDAGFSYYYSRPLLSASGTLTDGTERIPVSGQAWMDHQWGDFITLAGTGWDWFSLQLDNGSQYMFYVIYSERKPIATVGTYSDRNGVVRNLPADSISVNPIDTWTSPASGVVYPSGWVVTAGVEALSLTVTPAVRNQELVTAESTGVTYWEGAVTVSGTARGAPVTGLGYTELTGYSAAR